jgi:hypothetical protein
VGIEGEKVRMLMRRRIVFFIRLLITPIFIFSMMMMIIVVMMMMMMGNRGSVRPRDVSIFVLMLHFYCSNRTQSVDKNNGES